MVKIKVNLTLIKFVNKQDFTVDIEESAELADILNKTGIPVSEIGIVIKNGRWATVDCKVVDNDTIELFPSLSGG